MKTKSRRVISLILLCALLCLSAPGSLANLQGEKTISEVDLRVQGVGLGSSQAAVLRQLGRPLSTKREKIVDKYEVCGPPYTSLLLYYQGGVIELRGDLSWHNFEVVSIEITSPQFLIAPGIRIGMSEKEIRSKLGTPFQERDESGAHILNFATKGNDGGSGFYFVSGRLVKVHWEYTLC